jgi:hypothetical protein
MSQTSASFRANIQSQVTLLSSEARGAPSARSDQIRQALAESALRTGSVVAEEAPDVQEERDWVLQYGQIGQRTLVATMNTAGRCLAAWAGRGWCSSCQMNRELISSKGGSRQSKHYPAWDEQVLKHGLVLKVSISNSNLLV